MANAGIPSNGSFDVTDGEWERIWRINTMQQLWVARHLFPRWSARGSSTTPTPAPDPTPDPYRAPPLPHVDRKGLKHHPYPCP